ncbi:MAG TPA: CpsD/CapB family tyrosine-protein kinase [Acidobacteriota bacterium]|nr:CpsD/CapB family tyrosine-protein kinase [Acidobacteriota bacterium]
MARPNVPITEYFVADSAFATEFRRLLYRLMNLPDKRDLKSILVSSAILSEGKSTVAAFLAIVAARKGLKTLLVDCDLRRPVIHRLFALPRVHGVVELLSEGLAVKSVIKKTSVDKLEIITAGRLNTHPGDVFDAAAIGSLLADLKFYYDLILVDSPPVIPVSDPMLLASEVDGVLLVIKSGFTQREIVRRAVEILGRDEGKLLGFVMNNINRSLPYYYDHRHYGYDYAPRSNNDASGDRPPAGGGGSEHPPERSGRKGSKSPS